MTGADLSPDRFGTAFKAFMDAVVAAAVPPTSPLVERITAHLGVDPAQLPVITEEFDAFDQPNLQVAIDDYLAAPDRRATLIGVGIEQKRYMTFGLSDLLSRGSLHGMPILAEGPIDYVNFHLADDRVLSCVQFGLYLIGDGDTRLVALVTGPSDQGGPRQKLRIDVLAARAEDAQRLLADLLDGMRRLNVYRGHVISLGAARFAPGPQQALVTFHRLPRVARDDVVLPAGVLERIERQTIVFAEQAPRLLAAGRSLKRGLLLYGPPGVGKTLTIMHLAGRLPGRTILLTTGLGMGLLQPVMQLAQLLAPSMVVLEDIDLIAEERSRPFAGGPLLFELLNELDGLRDDCDIIFALTTNRPEILEPALAARPGRIDLAVELPLPDDDGRRRLLELYARGLTLREVDLERLVARTEGASPAYIKELLRKAAVHAAGASAGDGDAGVIVTGAHLEAALGELDEGGRLARQLLGFRLAQEPPPPHPVPGQPTPPGFPASRDWIAES